MVPRMFAYGWDSPTDLTILDPDAHLPSALAAVTSRKRTAAPAAFRQECTFWRKCWLWGLLGLAWSLAGCHRRSASPAEPQAKRLSAGSGIVASRQASQPGSAGVGFLDAGGASQYELAVSADLGTRAVYAPAGTVADLSTKPAPAPLSDLGAAAVDGDRRLTPELPALTTDQDGGVLAGRSQTKISFEAQFEEPGCFGWSVKRNALACIVGWESPYGESAFRLVFMPPIHPSVAVFRDRERRTAVDKGPLVSTDNNATLVAGWLKQDQFAPLPTPVYHSVQTADLTQPPLLVRWKHQVTDRPAGNCGEGFCTDISRDRVFIRCPGTPNGERTIFISEPAHFGFLSFDVSVLPGARFVAIIVRRSSWPRNDWSAGLVDTASRCHLYSDAAPVE